MRRVLVGGLVSFATTLVATPFVRSALVNRGSLDVPNHRSSHHSPVPRGGGLACLIGMALGTATIGRKGGLRPGMVIGTTALAALGLADDQLGHLHHNIRLAGQAIAGASLAPSTANMLPVAAGTVGVVNVVNFMDGINGISGSTAAVWGFATLATGREVSDPVLQTVGAVAAGAGLGFLPWNAPVAHIFLGDVGSYLFGGMMAAGIAHASGRPGLMWRVAAPLLPYGADAAQAILRRARAGESLTEAHRAHVYQRLADQGASHSAVAIYHVATAGLIAATFQRCSTATKTLVTAASLATYLASPSLIHAYKENRRLRAEIIICRAPSITTKGNA